jgi:transporter family-2 protein
MPIASLVLVLLAVVIGCGVPVQAGANATLARFYGHPLPAALTNTALASVLLLAAIIALRIPLPRLGNMTHAPWWSWTGGAFGATFVLSAIILAPRLGAGAYVSATIVGTVLASMLIDHFALIGFEAHALTPARLLGAALLLGGMFLIQTN